MDQENFEIEPEKVKKKKKGSIWLKILIVILAILLVIMIALASAVTYVLGRLGRIETDETGDMTKMSDEFDTDGNQENLETVDATDVSLSAVDILEGADVVNIMLIGQDRREGETRARSDSMILVTLNTTKNTIQLTSFMRDTYVRIPGYLDNRLNVAYRYGDVVLMNETFLVNFGLEIDGNVMVDFDEFTNIIDILGGVDIEVTSEEARYMRNHGYSDVKAGMNHLDSDAALTFTRMRYISGSDYGRTERQRRVLVALAESIRDSDVVTILDLVNQVLPHISTNLTDAQIVRYVSAALTILADGNEIQTLRIPADDAHYSASVRGMSVLIPDLEECREDLYEFIYATEGEE